MKVCRNAALLCIIAGKVFYEFFFVYYYDGTDVTLHAKLTRPDLQRYPN